MFPISAKRLMLLMPLFLGSLLLLVGGEGVEAVGCGYTRPEPYGDIIDQDICNCNSEKTVLIDCNNISSNFSGQL
jgi:hypothetical protein